MKYGLISWLTYLTPWHWFSLGAIFIVLDISLGASFLLLWIGISAGLVGVLLFIFPSISWEAQLLIFSCEIFSCIFFWRTFLKNKIDSGGEKPNLNRRSMQYIGRKFVLEFPIENGYGKVHVDDSIWKISGEDMEIGTTIIVTGVSGVILEVEKV